MFIFAQVKYYLSSSLPQERQTELSHVLDSNGAERANSLGEATHIITNSDRFEGWQDINEDVAIVTGKWVDRSMVLGKCQATQHYSANPAMIFSGVVACATELPTHDLEVLSAGITALGGQWRTGLTKDVTHLFATSPTSTKYTTAMHFQEHTHVKVLLPHWFDDAVRLGVGGLSVDPYEWPDPPLLRALPPDVINDEAEGEGNADLAKKIRKLDAEKRSLYKTALWTPGSDLPSLASLGKDIWGGRKILLSPSLELRGGRREAVESGIRRARGTVVEYQRNSGDGDAEEEAMLVGECDVLVTRWRSGRAYAAAVRAGKTIGTLSWLFHVESTGVVTRPMDQLLHYPTPKRAIEGFSYHEITVTNYTGESREYIKRLISAMGAQFTPSMSGRNTVLIAAYISGTKTTKARSWSIPIVNHTWLEDCFIKWRNLTVALEKYIVFPPGVDFANLLGERGVGRGVEGVDLEELEEEEEEGVAEVADEAGTKNSKRQAGTQNSAKDAKEIEELVGGAMNLFDGDGDVLMKDGGNNVNEGELEMDVDEEIPSPKRPKPKPYSPHTSPASKPVSTAKAKQPLKTVLPKGIYSETSSDEEIPRLRVSPRDIESDGEDEGGGRTNRKEARVSSKSSEKAHARTSPRKAEVQTSTSARRKVNEMRQENSTDDEGSDDSGLEVIKKTKAMKPKEKKVIQDKKTIIDTDSDESEVRTGSTLAEHRGLSKGGKSKQTKGGAADAVPAVISPTKTTPKGVPRRVLSVVMPPLVLTPSKKSPNKSANSGSSMSARKPAAPTRTESVRVVADERGRGSGRPSMTGSGAKAKVRGESSPASSVRSGTPSKEFPLIRTPSKRDAAAKASRKLRDEVMPDVMNYQSEMRNQKARKSTGGGGGGDRGNTSGKKKRPSDILSVDGEEEETGRSKKRAKTSMDSGTRKVKEPNGDSDESSDETRSKPSKSLKKARVTFRDEGESSEETPPPLTKKLGKKSAAKSKKSKGEGAGSAFAKKVSKSIQLMTTQVALSDEVVKVLTKLGVKMTTRPSECTHLLAPHLVRTEKFLCALAVAPLILSEKWALASAAAKQILPEEDYLLHDKVNERKYNFRLADAVRRAKELGGKLFANKTFYVTPKVSIDIKLLKNVASAGGGQVTTQLPSVRILNASPDRHVISCPADISIWRPIAQHHPIFTQELLLTGALRQEIPWEDETYRVPSSF